METLTDRNSYLKATNKDGFCLLEATASWCSQCKAIQPFVDKMIKKYPDCRFYKPQGSLLPLKQGDGANFQQYDTDTADDISQELGANQMPTFHAFKDGDLMGSVTYVRLAINTSSSNIGHGRGAKAKELESLIKESYDGKIVDTEE
ncbi:hypothetical protein LTR17_016396 [Elasticomyces elasticus]|nr:hypothetical protein LTR17_016396 [Elasticomyces elasticus]